MWRWKGVDVYIYEKIKVHQAASKLYMIKSGKTK
ncbi:MAG: hypothetical protein UZ08_BCD001000969 [Candidatus Parvibacillus calidus]|jgi:hypothetical protein|nr:MAG: hypothetical protein UZ08_BCD001000969 [Candidatus Parvibacillus calidus]